ncbi:hypothetical protein EJD96_14530 [Herbaspirillum seropedicae]|nr:hypothetical protein [Herbaspirillum seropedicae]QDD65288.1 hypothetical protein EJD96_14530 [Herbaspirillum seropedicae]
MIKNDMQAFFADAKGVSVSLCALVLTLAAGGVAAQAPDTRQAAAPAGGAATAAAPAPVTAAPMTRERFEQIEARTPIRQRYPAGSIKSVEMAQAVLDEVAEDRQAVQLRYVLDQRACAPKFLVNKCLEEARDRKRLAEKDLKQAEYEANVFQRQANVDDRDRSLADQRAKDQEDAARRQAEQKQKEADSARKVQESNAKNREVQQRIDANKDVPADYRVREHEAKQRQQRAEDAARAPERAANAAERQRRIQEAEQHRLEVERNKAEKERERAQRQQNLQNQQQDSPTTAPAAR